MLYPIECDSKRIQHVTLYKPRFSSTTGSTAGATAACTSGGPSASAGNKKRRGPIKAFHFVFWALYVYQAYWCFRTCGEPYRKFLSKAEKEGFQVMEGTTKMRAELEYALADINNPDRRPTDKLGWFDWMHLDIDEANELKKKSKEQSVLDSLPKHMRVPKQYMPEFLPMLLWGIFATIHVLIMLMQHWNLHFNLWLNYQEVNVEELDIPTELLELDDEDEERFNAEKVSSAGGSNSGAKQDTATSKSYGQLVYQRSGSISIPSHLPTHARITPTSSSSSNPTSNQETTHKEKDTLVPLLYVPTLGLSLEYHRRRYTYNPDTHIWTKIRCSTKMPTTFFSSWDGFTNSQQITASEIRYGSNEFNVHQPTFMEMYKSQLLSPFTVFQLFCVILWLLDDYWQYSFFTLFMILSFEATVVFSRIKSLGALRGMGNQSRRVMVFRMNHWVNIESASLLPGDVMSLTRDKQSAASGKDDKQVDVGTPIEGGDIVPADLLLLCGSAVVTEASLTGESVPQIKEGFSEFVEGEELSMKVQHKTHVLYAGTKMLQCKGVDTVDSEIESGNNEGKKEDSITGNYDKLYGSIPKPPDGGSLCFVLRTGFLSAQGKLVRMIEGSQEKVKGHERETGLLLLLLFFFAVASSSYVLYHGLQNDKRSQYELLLHCILIITSVIPPELPMQMALAVNNSLMTLMKMQVFCTEPYRVPIAGKLDACLFDKTGTLTTDELVAVGVCGMNALSKGKASSIDPSELLTPMTKVTNEAALVLAGCNSLVLIDGETTGDPLESAALTAMRWSLSKGTGNAIPSPATEKKLGGKGISLSGMSSHINEVEVLARHHFSSKLQRMSCVVRDVKQRRAFAVAKGSPEAIGKLLLKKPEEYDDIAKILAKRGYRVIALGFKHLPNHDDIEAAKDKRASCEADISFAGFVAFTCRVRKDTKKVLAKLIEGGMSVAMITGDALLTAAHVAKEVGICNSNSVDCADISFQDESEDLKELLKQVSKSKGGNNEQRGNTEKPILILEQASSGQMFWQSYDDDCRVADFVASDVPELSIKYDLATTGKNLSAAYDYDEITKQVLGSIKIFARMTPDAKETVIECLHSVGKLCLMCGDGANDVGALKQADVGVALLTGFGDVNVDKGEDSSKIEKNTQDSHIPASTIMTKEQLESLKLLPVPLIKANIRRLGVEPNNYPDIVEKDDLVKLFQIKAKERAVKTYESKLKKQKAMVSKSEKQVKQKQDMAGKQQKLMERIKELEEQGVQWAQFKAMKEFYAAEGEQAKKNKAKLAKTKGVEGSAANMIAQMEDLELDEVPMVKLGDASIAAPFTSKMPSIKSCVDIVRQGRCTLVTSMQMYQILALNCLISSYSLSVLYLDGVKYGDVQMTAMGMLMSISFMSVSRSKPLDRLSAVKPLTSIFHPSMFISLLGQFSVHLVVMMLAVNKAKSTQSPGHEVDLDGEFKPGILNSVVFLVSNVQQVTVFVVNLQGRPFMTGLTENRPLLWSLVATFILTFMFASESVPGLNKYFQLVPFPDEAFRDFILKILVADVILSIFIDRFMKLLFCPQILFASLKDISAKSIMSLARTIGSILALMYVFLGNDEQWEDMLREEGRDVDFEESFNSTLINATTGMNDSSLIDEL